MTSGTKPGWVKLTASHIYNGKLCNHKLYSYYIPNLEIMRYLGCVPDTQFHVEYSTWTTAVCFVLRFFYTKILPIPNSQVLVQPTYLAQYSSLDRKSVV